MFRGKNCSVWRQVIGGPGSVGVFHPHVLEFIFVFPVLRCSSRSESRLPISKVPLGPPGTRKGVRQTGMPYHELRGFIWMSYQHMPL